MTDTSLCNDRKIEEFCGIGGKTLPGDYIEVDLQQPEYLQSIYNDFSDLNFDGTGINKSFDTRDVNIFVGNVPASDPSY